DTKYATRSSRCNDASFSNGNNNSGVMDLQGKEILLASLVGSRVVESMPRLATVQNEVMKHVTPPISFLPFKRDDNVDAVSHDVDYTTWQANPVQVEKHFVPISFRRAGTKDPFYTLPSEPMISVTGKNNIVKRTI